MTEKDERFEALREIGSITERACEAWVECIRTSLESGVEFGPHRILHKRDALAALASIQAELTEIRKRCNELRGTVPWDERNELRKELGEARSLIRKYDKETASIHADMLALGRLLGVPYDGVSSPAGYLHGDIMPAIERLKRTENP